MIERITVIGAGNGGQALAADCKLGGKTVTLFELEKYQSSIESIMSSKEIMLYGPELNAKNFKRNGVAKLDAITTDMKEAMKDAQLILVCVRALAFEEIFDQMIDYLEDGQVISIIPDNYGALVFRRMMKEKNCTKNIIVGGWNSLPYGCRVVKRGPVNEIYNMYRAVALTGDAMPSCDKDEFFRVMNECPVWDTVECLPGDTMLDVGFSNPNPILHVPSSILNMGAIDNWGSIVQCTIPEGNEFYDIYKHGFSYHVSKIQYKLYLEECEIAKALGVGIQHFDKEVFFSRTSVIGPEYMGEGFAIPFEEHIPNDEWMKHLPGDRFTMETRYVTEDIPVGCNMYYELAKLANVDTPVIRSMISLGSVVHDTNYFNSNFNLKFLGLDNMTIEDIGHYLRHHTD